MQCQKCKVDLIARERSSSVSAAGLVGALIGLIGILVLLFGNVLVGLVVLIVGLLVGLQRDKRLTLICPSCKRETRVA